MSVKKDTKRGTWFFVVDVPGPNGQRKQHRGRGFATKKKAEEAQTELLAKIQRGEYVPRSRETIRDYLESTWLPAVARKVRPTTADGYRRTVAKHIAPLIGTVELQALDEAQVAYWLGQLVDAGLSPKSVRNVHGVLSASLEYARMPLRLVNRNVARGAELPALPQRKNRAWSAEQIGQFLAHVEGDRWAPLWRLIATTGMRRGEALGLRWSDVDVGRGVITITNQRTIAGGRVVEGEPKSDAGRRSVTVDAGTLTALRTWRRQQAQERLLMGAGWHGGDYVFTWPDGSLPWPQRVTAWFKVHSSALGLPNIGVHGLRHSAATWMISSGVSPKVVTQRLGHSHVSVTLQLYAHVLPAHDQAAADAFAAALDARS